MESTMERGKKFGLIAIACAAVLAIASLVFSENICYSGATGDSWFNLLSVCLRIKIYGEIPLSSFGDQTYLHLETKYLLLACSILFAVGIFWHKGALPVPGAKADLGLNKTAVADAPKDS
jgi:hypothetical protein